MPPKFRSLRQELRPLYLGGRPYPLVVALAAYFDESKRLSRGAGDERHRIVAMAGYIGPVDVWDHVFTPAWQRVISEAPHKIAEFKASDCRQGTDEFEPPWTPEERRELTERVVSVIENMPKFTILGVGAAVLLDFTRIESEEDRLRLADFAWLWCFTMVTSDAMQFAKKMLSDDQHLQIVFDEDDLEFRARQSFQMARTTFAPEIFDRVRKPLFEPSHLVEPLQAADLLAHETYKEIENRSEIPPRPPSRALGRLVASHHTHAARYYDFHTMRDIDTRVRAGDSTATHKAGIIYDNFHHSGIVRDITPF